MVHVKYVFIKLQIVLSECIFVSVCLDMCFPLSNSPFLSHLCGCSDFFFFPQFTLLIPLVCIFSSLNHSLPPKAAVASALYLLSSLALPMMLSCLLRSLPGLCFHNASFQVSGLLPWLLAVLLHHTVRPWGFNSLESKQHLILACVWAIGRNSKHRMGHEIILRLCSLVLICTSQKVRFAHIIFVFLFQC